MIADRGWMISDLILRFLDFESWDNRREQEKMSLRREGTLIIMIIKIY